MNGLDYDIGRDGWVHVTDPKFPGVIREKCGIQEILGCCRDGAEVAAWQQELLRLRGIGKKTVAAWIEQAGWKPSFERSEELDHYYAMIDGK